MHKRARPDMDKSVSPDMRINGADENIIGFAGSVIYFRGVDFSAAKAVIRH